MANVEHATLTDPTIHESKGVSTATSGQVYVANGLGSGTWTTITNPFGSGLFHVRDEKTSGTNGQALTATTWNTRQLTTVKTNEISGAALSSNQITGLTAGTYIIMADAGCHNVTQNFHKIKLYNVTGAADLIVGFSLETAAAGTNDYAQLRGKFTLGATSTVELRHWVANGCDGGQSNTIASTIEVYTDVMIWKIT